ncbi:MAG: nuclear transport factor 2 family protein [Agriterribacter sp.]
MRFLFTIALFFSGLIASAQSDSVVIKANMETLDKAFLEKNYTVIEQLVNADVSYGHSTGWIQTKKDLKDDFASGKITYKKIESTNIHFTGLHKNWATVRLSTAAEGVAQGKDFNVNIQVLQVWVKENNKWQLAARQAVKVAEPAK